MIATRTLLTGGVVAGPLYLLVGAMQMAMPAMNGIEAAIQLKERGSTAKVIFLTIHEDGDFIQAALRIGASGYVFKRRITSDLSLAVSEALADRIFISPT